MDVQHVADNDAYFVFEEGLGNVVLAFSRDGWVLQHSAVRTHAPLAPKASHDVPGWRQGSPVPPCAVQPFRGFVSYAAPLSFVYEHEEPMYFCLRVRRGVCLASRSFGNRRGFDGGAYLLLAQAMYAQYWCRLNVMRTAPNTRPPAR